MGKPYLIRVSSQKGGVGKTTVAVNLATWLATSGYRVLLFDTDFTNPSVGFHLGLEDANIGMQSVLAKRSRLQNAVVPHDASGMHILPCELSSKVPVPTDQQIKNTLAEISRSDYHFAIGDTPPGFFTEGLEGLYDEALILTTPDLPAIASVMRLASKYDKISLKHSLVINRVRHRRYEVNLREIEGSYGKSAEAVLPESDIVPRSIAEHIPAILLDPRDEFTKAANEMGHKFTYKVEGGQEKQKRGRRESIISMFFKRLRFRRD